MNSLPQRATQQGIHIRDTGGPALGAAAVREDSGSNMERVMKNLVEVIGLLDIEVDNFITQLKPVLNPPTPANPSSKPEMPSDIYRLAVMLQLQAERINSIRSLINETRQRLDV